MWQASPEQIAEIARLHTETVNRYQPSCSGFVCNNSKLREFIASQVDAATASQYSRSIGQIRAENVEAADGKVMRKEELNPQHSVRSVVNGTAVAVGVMIVLIGLFVWMRRRKKSMN
jgi:cobaltochelatase CobN